MRRSFLTTSVGAGLLLALGLAVAPVFAQDAVDGAAVDFVTQEGFEVLPLEHIEGGLADMLGGDPEAMIPADVDISPIEKALLLLDTQEEPAVRVRYLLRYNEQTVDGVTLSLISVERYNLGPTIREETIAAYGAENTAGPEAFGIGPHVRWRFVTQPTAKVPALLLAASRQEISNKSASRTSCLIRTCLSLAPLDEFADWSEWTPHDTALPVVAYDAILEGALDAEQTEIAPAALALQLAIDAGLAEQGADGTVWTMPERQGGEHESPYLVVLIDRNLGQEIMSDGALGVAKLGLDSVETWTRLSGGVFDGVAMQSEAHAEGPLQ